MAKREVRVEPSKYSPQTMHVTFRQDGETVGTLFTTSPREAQRQRKAFLRGKTYGVFSR